MRLFGLFLIYAASLSSAQIELFLDWQPEAKDQTLFEEWPLLQLMRKQLLEKGWDICSWEREKHRSFSQGGKDPCWVFWGLGPTLENFSFPPVDKKHLTLFIWEPPTVQPESYDPKVQEPFGKIFTWNDDLVDGIRFFKFHYPVLTQRIEKIPSFEEKKFCTLIASRLSSKHPNSLYKEREKIIRFFENKPKEFDLYGRNWEKRKFKNYRGAIPNKLEVLKNYKFCICYENTKEMTGYVTEKIFDCFAAGSVPIYWGASNITDYIPAECFIDRRRFSSDEELYSFLKSLSKQRYETYLSAAAQFLKSEKADLFSIDHFIKTFFSAFFKN